MLGQDGGGLFQSQDGGAHWAEQEQMKGQSDSFADGLRPSDPKLVIAGKLSRGFFPDEKDSGTAFGNLISPSGE